MAKRDFAVTAPGILNGVRRIAPDITIDMIRNEDPYFIWDGDGPDPVREGYVPYNVTVRAEVQTIEGETLWGDDMLGGVYDIPDEKDPNVHGYFPQMLDAALEELHISIAGKKATGTRKAWDPREARTADPERVEYARQVKEAIAFVKRSMGAIYEREERLRRRREE